MDGNRAGEQNCYKMQNRVPEWGGPCLAEEMFLAEKNNNGIWVRFASETHSVHKALAGEAHIRVPHAQSIIISKPLHHCFPFK